MGVEQIGGVSIVAMLVVVAAAMIAGTCACAPAGYYRRVATFPPGSKWLDNDWEYVADVRVLFKGGEYRKSDKTVQILVYGFDRERLLEDELTVECASVEATITWAEFGVLEVELEEEGVEYEGSDAKYNDPYSVALARSGPRPLARLSYRYNDTAKRFERVRTAFPERPEP